MEELYKLISGTLEPEKAEPIWREIEKYRKDTLELLDEHEESWKNKITNVYKAGILDGLRRYAWWKDGEEQVGTCGTSLKSAIKDVDEERVSVTLINGAVVVTRGS